MPFLAPIVAFLAANAPAIGAASAIAGAGTTIGEAIANSGGPPTPGAPTTPPGPTPPTLQQLMQQRSLVSQQLPNVVGATSGLANPAYDSLIAQILAGTLGQPGSTASGNAAAGFAPGTGQSFQAANSQPTNAAVSGGPLQLSDFINTSTQQ